MCSLRGIINRRRLHVHVYPAICCLSYMTIPKAHWLDTLAVAFTSIGNLHWATS